MWDKVVALWLFLARLRFLPGEDFRFRTPFGEDVLDLCDDLGLLVGKPRARGRPYVAALKKSRRLIEGSPFGRRRWPSRNRGVFAACRRGREQPHLGRPPQQFRDVGHIQLLHQVTAVGLDGSRRAMQGVGDLPIVLAVEDQVQNFPLGLSSKILPRPRRAGVPLDQSLHGL